jgi:hypothetical protein
MEVLALLHSKKKCLRKFLTLSELFLASAETGDLTGLTRFEQQREIMIKALDLYDRKLTDAACAVPLAERTPELSADIQRILEDKAYLVQSILKLDNRIFACIEREKERLLREATAVHKNKEVTGRFKSAWVPEAGEGLDTKV